VKINNPEHSRAIALAIEEMRVVGCPEAELQTIEAELREVAATVGEQDLVHTVHRWHQTVTFKAAPRSKLARLLFG
jgi:hypothetical protein